MPFDRSDLIQLQALKDEVDADPISMGYAATGGVFQQLMGLLNLSENNQAPENGAAPMTVGALLKAIFGIPVSSQDQFKVQLLFESTQSQNGNLSNFKTEVSSLSPAIEAAVTSIVRPLSRVEVLFAIDDSNGVREYISLTKQDILAMQGL